MALQPLFRLGASPIGGQGSVKGLFAFWMGGACVPGTGPATSDKSRALRQVERGLSTEAEYREIALRREKQERLAAFNILREQIEDARRQELALIAPEPIDTGRPKPRKSKKSVPIVLPIEAQRVEVRATIDRLEAAALREIDDIRRLEANLLRIQLEDEDDDDVVLLITMLM